MKSNLLFVPLLLACSALCAPPPQPDPLAESLFPPDLVMHQAEAIGLTEDQKEFVQTEMQNAHARFGEMHQKLQKEVEATAALLRKDRVDEAVALAQFDKVLNQEREIKRAHLALVLAIKNKLTAEQQKKLAELKKQLAPGETHAGRTPPRLPPEIPEKMSKLQTKVKQWQENGRDPTPIAELMQGFDPLMKEAKFKEAEELLDKALKLLEAEEKKSDAGTQKSAAAILLPPPSGKSPEAFAAEIQSLRPAKLVWREIQWRQCLLAGLAEARAQKKPVILWAFINSSPCDERC